MRIYITALMLAVTLVLTSCGGGNETSSTGASVTAQATIATVSACNASSSFGGAGPLLTEASNPTLEACNTAIAFTCNASTTFGGTEPALTATTSPSIKTCLAVMNESNSNNPSGSKVLAGQATIGATCSFNGVTNIQAGTPCSFQNCLGVIRGDTFSGFALPNQNWQNTCNLIYLNNYSNPNQCIFIGGTPYGNGCG